MADLDSSRRVLHPGVDPQTWLGFEQRMQARRFNALVTSAREALATGDLVGAHHAIAEAREIRSHSPELDELDAQASRIAAPPRHDRVLWRRAAGATVLLVLGASMFVALDHLRVVPTSTRLIEPASPLLPANATIRATEIPLPEISEIIVARTATTEQAPARVEPLATVSPTATAERIDRSASAPRDFRSDAAVTAALSVPRPPSMSLQPLPSTNIVTRPAPRRGDVLPGTPTSGSVSTDGPGTPPSAAPVPTAPAAPAPIDLREQDQSRVADVLSRYARAYGSLDARAARAVWPGVDEHALARAFESLASQSVSFDECHIDVRGAFANASCRGHASYVGKVGRSTPRTEPRTWRFELRREGDTWKIEHAEARRTSG